MSWIKARCDAAVDDSECNHGIFDLHPVQKLRHGEIFILDDDRGARDALQAALENVGYHATCFSDDSALLSASRQRSPLCTILDMTLAKKSRMDTLADLASYPAPVLVTSSRGDIGSAVNAMKAGAADFIPKPVSADAIVIRIGAALRAHVPAGKRPPGGRISALNFSGRDILSRREKDVLDQVAAGMSSKQAAAALGISWRTVEDHRANILRKLGVKNSAELMLHILKSNAEPENATPTQGSADR